MQNLYLIDASGYLYRSYFAISRMTNDKGESTNALYGFIRSLLKLMKDFGPTHFIAIFDGPGGAQKREAIYPEYKAHRDEMPGDLRYQMQWAREFCQLAGIPLLDVPGVEADDTIGSVALWAAQQGATTYICTTDKDMSQLVSEHILLLNTFKDNLILGKKEIEEIYGVPPERMVDWLAITGDASDNVPGISGFGPKTATALLQEFGSLDALLTNPERISSQKKRETVIAQAEQARLSRQLVTLDTEVPFPKEESFFQLTTGDISELKKLYARMNFNTLLRELGETPEVQQPATPELPISYSMVDDEAGLQTLIEKLTQQTEVCFKPETTDSRPLLAELVGLGFCFKAGEAYYVPANGRLGLKRLLQAFKPVFENSSISFYTHHAKYALHVLSNYGIKLANLTFDTSLASYLLNSHNRQHGLDYLVMHYFGKRKIPLEELVGKGKKQISMREAFIEQVTTFSCEEVDYTFRLKELLTQQLQQRHLDALMNDLEMPLLQILTRMERTGIYVDVQHLKVMANEIAKISHAMEQEIHTLAGEEFNISSPKQLSQILFHKMGIHPPRKTSTGLSTDADVLESLQEEYPIAGKVLEYRTLEKLRSTYLEALPHEVNSDTLRIHCTFNQSVAATGRLSCQDPNLQNIPVRSDIGRKIRGAFRPQQSGYSFLAADYSQIELRLMAHLSSDPQLIDAFLNNRDVHAHTASVVFNVPLEEVTKDQREQAKAVNFGVIYGQQAFGLARGLNLSVKTAAAFIKTYFERYDTVRKFVEQCKEEARLTGKTVTLSGRERLIPEIHSKNATFRAAAERLAVNSPLQGGAADIIKMAMLKVSRKLEEANLKVKMVLQIHDELVFEVADEDIDSLKTIVKESMENVYPLKIPLVVDIRIGKNWEEC